MSDLLYIIASPRGSFSKSVKVGDAFVESYSRANPSHDVDRLDLWEENLPAFDGDMLEAKYAVMHGEAPTDAQNAAWDKVGLIANRFKNAKKYVFAIPMWNFGIPYLLKQYIDIISQPGLTWGLTPDSNYVGLVDGKVFAVYSSGGSFSEGGDDLQKSYFKSWLEFVGLELAEQLVVAPTLAPAEVLEKQETELIEKATELGRTF